MHEKNYIVAFFLVIPTERRLIWVVYNMGVLKQFGTWDIFCSEGIETYLVKIFKSN